MQTPHITKYSTAISRTKNDKRKNGISDMIKRYALFLVGLFIASMGVAFSTKAGFGTSPVASVPYSVSLVNDLFSFGEWLNIFDKILHKKQPGSKKEFL